MPGSINQAGFHQSSRVPSIKPGPNQSSLGSINQAGLKQSGWAQSIRLGLINQARPHQHVAMPHQHVAMPQ